MKSRLFTHHTSSDFDPRPMCKGPTYKGQNWIKAYQLVLERCHKPATTIVPGMGWRCDACAADHRRAANSSHTLLGMLRGVGRLGDQGN